MNGAPKKLKDQNGNYILPVTHADLVFVESNKTLTQKIAEGGLGGSGASIDDANTTATDKTWSANKIYNVTEGKSDTNHSHELQDITDIDATNKTNGYALQYNSSTGKFTSSPLPNGTGSGATNLNGLSDVDTTTNAPSEDDVLSFKGGTWVPAQANNGNVEYKENATVPLNVPSYYKGKNQGCHPSVLYFSSKFNGYYYWMAFTPYPNSDAYEENPAIAASNDGVNWEIPSGLTNPIDSINPEVKGNEYFSDTHLVYRSDTATLECWYRKAILSPVKCEKIYRKTTTNGTIWSAAQELYSVAYSVNDRILSPVAIWDSTNNKYLIWAVEAYKVIYYESTDGTNWQRIRDTGLSCWHLNVLKTDVGFEYLLQKTNTMTTTLNHVVSTDNITFGTEKILMNGRPQGFWDMGLYRSALVKIGTQYRVYYSARNNEQVWRIGLSISTKPNDITSLKGFDGYSNPFSVTNAFVDLAEKLIDVLPLLKGTTNERKKMFPYLKSTKFIGVPYFDITLNKPLWIKSISGDFPIWVDSTGTVVPTTDNPPVVSQSISDISIASGQNVVIDFTASDDIAIATFAYSTNGGSSYTNVWPAELGGDNYRYSIIGLAVGTYQFKVGAKDQSQQWTYSNTFSVTVS